MFWSGSTTVSGQTYSGLGMELMDTSESYLKFTTEGDGDLDIRAKKFFVGTPASQFISGSGGDIEISSSLFHLDPANDKLIIGAGTTINAELSVNSLFVPASTTDSNAKAYISSSGVAKFGGDAAGAYDAEFYPAGAGVSKIAGWDIGPTFLSSSNIILSSSGTIQTSDFQSSLLGTGKGWKIGSDGVAEFEEARIRGTLSTVTFEKDTISAVGGQVIIANATTVSGSDVVRNMSQDWSDFLVESSDGFVVDEYVIAKATGSTGFQTELMKVSVVVPGVLRLLRNVDTNGSLPTLSTGQVLVSQGFYSATTQSGYIHMNADPGDATTPYIDIVERTGSGVDDIKSRARLGDLSGLAGVGPVPADPGFGLYSENVFLSGTITASAGEIGGWSIGATKLSTGGFEIAASGSNDYAISSSGFTVKHDGLVAAANFAEKMVTVTSGNKANYFKDDSNTDVKLVFDGSEGGEVTMNMQLNVAPYNTAAGAVKPISDIILPLEAAGVKMEATVIINVDGVEFKNDSIADGIGNMSKA
jgi:hypothetical protein